MIKKIFFLKSPPSLTHTLFVQDDTMMMDRISSQYEVAVNCPPNTVRDLHWLSWLWMWSPVLFRYWQGWAKSGCCYDCFNVCNFQHHPVDFVWFS